ARLQDEIAAPRQRSERAVEAVVVDRGREAGGRGALDGLAAHPDGVDLVDEDDALAAPLGREPLRLPREEADDDGVDPEERLREPRAGDRDEGRVEAGRDRLCEHRLPGAGRSQEEESALALSSGPLERLAGLP